MTKTAFLLIFLICGTSVLRAQDSTWTEKAAAYQQHLNQEFSDPKTSPLDEENIAVFEGLPFFDINEKLIFQAEFFRTPYESPFVMETTTGRESIYVKYGEVYFTIDGKEYKLNVYQSQQLSSNPEYADYLFVPFTDLTNGKSTYGGGRYLDLHIPEGETVLLDFNRAYNPYCAYGEQYSCPVPPAENDLKIPIKAGVKYEKH
ncbi:MAG TPA: DUF1684 domain-containing protein [Flavobacteriaceae bacterium]|nr:DUF1684 domain-containing protein [Flavobacteriaceae bacterium]